MPAPIEFKEKKQSILERFGIYYLSLFGKRELGHHVFDFSDDELAKKINRISLRGILLSGITGALCVWPTVYVDLLKESEPWQIHYAWTAAVTIVSVAIEFYLLFLIALKAVHEVSELINIHSHKKDFLKNGPFNVTNILSRTALEISDPEMQILGIDPFKQVSKLDLFLLGMLYKLKIFLTNFISKFLLLRVFGKTIAGISINFIAVPVEFFWNGVVLHRVVHEARLRLFGFALSNHIVDNLLHDHLLDQLSEEAKIGCLRAIGNAVVLAKYYHPNIIILLMRFQHLLHIDKDNRYDKWDLFLESLRKVSEKERNFILDLFTIAIAFDGKVSKREMETIKTAYGNDFEMYHPRLLKLTENLRKGRLHAAYALCKLDFTAG